MFRNECILFKISINFTKRSFKLKEKENCRKADGNNVRYRLSHIYAYGVVAYKMRHNIDKRQEQNELSDHGDKHRGGSVAKRNESHLAGYLYAKKYHSAKIYAQSSRRKIYKRAVGRKN